MTIPQLVSFAGLSGVALSLIMAAAWRMQQRTGNSGWVDTTWSFGTGFVAVTAALVPVAGAIGWRQVLVGALAAAWSLRLGAHIARRSSGASDDPRYRQMQDAWGSAAPRRMFWFLQAQAAAGVPLVMAVALAAHHPASGVRIQDVIGAILLVIALTGEAAADAQLRRFKASGAADGLCRTGLWGWSRHPNYFFEWLAWLAYPVIAIGDGHALGWLALLAPACMYWLLVHVSGIPPLEAHLERTRGQAFREYKRATSPFFPLPPARQSGGR
jgi:steroid 5-alpha reductase family enzyme